MERERGDRISDPLEIRNRTRFLDARDVSGSGETAAVETKVDDTSDNA